jgi:hypothetical protein
MCCAWCVVLPAVLRCLFEVTDVSEERPTYIISTKE